MSLHLVRTPGHGWPGRGWEKARRRARDGQDELENEMLAQTSGRIPFGETQRKVTRLQGGTHAFS